MTGSPIDSWELAFGDIAILEDRDLYLDCMEGANERFANQPLWWRHQAARDMFRDNGGRLIDELPAEAQSRYKDIRGLGNGERRDDRR
jgi:hypothetical protein